MRTIALLLAGELVGSLIGCLLLTKVFLPRWMRRDFGKEAGR